MTIVKNYISHTLRTILSSDWRDMPAFHLGIIDENGKILRQRSTLETLEEKRAYPSPFFAVAWNLKRMVESSSRSAAQIALRGIMLREYCVSMVGDGDFIEVILREELSSRGILESVILEEAQPKAINPGWYYIRGIGRTEVKEIVLPCEEFFGHPIYRIGKTMFTIEDVQREDAPVNAVGHGNIAGVSPGQEPPGKRGKFFRRNVKKTKELKKKLGL